MATCRGANDMDITYTGVNWGRDLELWRIFAM
jgi:hypothetical protein